MARLEVFYKNEVAKELMKKFEYKNVMEIPKIEKVTINIGAGDSKDNSKLLDAAVSELAIIAGQQPIITKAKKSVSNFKVREGMKLGCKVTLRGKRMYEFIDRLFNIALPRVRDFRGINNIVQHGHKFTVCNIFLRAILIILCVNYSDFV